MFAFFNNHRQGQAARNAEMFEAMLATRFPPAAIRKAAGPAAKAGEGGEAQPEPQALSLFEAGGESSAKPPARKARSTPRRS